MKLLRRRRITLRQPAAPTVKIKTITPVILNEDDIEECKQRDQLQTELKKARRDLEKKKKECDEKIYAKLHKFFNAQDKNTIKDLLIALYQLYTQKREKHGARYNLSLLTFLEYFPATTTGGISNFRRQHVFEAICKAMLVLNYDNNHWGKNKKFYKSLEDYVKSETGRKEMTVSKIWDEKINAGAAAGSVDIFFKISGDENVEAEKEAALCERNFEEEKERIKGKEKDLFVMIQNKYYAHEYSTADKYDVIKILSRARPLLSNEFNNSIPKLILMVNNKQDLLTKIKKNRNQDFSIVTEDQIFGAQELNVWFLRMLYDMQNSTDFDTFLGPTNQKNKEDLQLRFHQKFFVNTTSAYLNLNEEDKRKKFVWGAVPRSGKSYMIGGLIDKRQSDTVLIVLGAKSETETQFVEMFEKFNNFKDYGKITASKATPKKAKNIIILSQEKIKVKGRKLSEDDVKKGKKDPDEKFWEDYKEFFPPDKPIDIYFDEIHKGGTTEKAQKQIIQAFKERCEIELFVMVTATYAKPTIAYSSVIDTHNPIILNWSYSDQQNMKKVSNRLIRDEIIESRNDDIQKKQLTDLFEDYEKQFQSQYLSILEEKYKKYPELVILRGEKTAKLMNIHKTEKLMNIHGNTFLLKCSAMAATKELAKDPTEIFKNNQGVKDLIKSIGHYENKSGGDILSPSTLYDKLNKDFGYDVVNTRHTQLWFLPYSHLYEPGNKCDDLQIKNIKQEITGEESKDEMKERQGLPNIEPLARGMVLNLLSNPFFKKHFCFLIVHGQKLKYFKDEIDWTDEGECVDLSVGKRKPINKIIKEFEEKSFKEEGKSLIILTGSMLRLGISISCADIAFNFDNIKSVDLNYQTMFRVLTERQKKNGKWKEYGYYYDFYPERAIEFLYKYNLTYVDSLKKTENMKQSVESLQALLYLFNYNGLGIVKGDTEKTLKIYEDLITDLKLTEKDYSEHFIKDSFKSILSLLNTNPISKGLLGKINKLNLQGSFNIKKIKHEKKGKPQEHAYRTPPAADKDEDPEEEEEEDAPLSQQDIALYIKDYTAILALFSNPSNNNCENISECIEKVKKNTNLFGELCDCVRIPIPVLGCYMKRIKRYSKKQFSASLDIFEKIIDEDPEKRNLINIIFGSIKEAMGKSSMLIYDKTPEEVDKIIQEYLPVRKIEKDTYGEVFTPPTLINEMLDKLPPHVWKNKDLKWLDPANGTGNFPMVAYGKLMIGLEKEIPNKKDRSKHIIKKMLYMVELNEKNVAISRKIFGPDANIACANFLTEENKWKRKFEGVDTFDVIMGNPPFQRSQAGKRKGGFGGRTLWDKFVRKILPLLKSNGFLVFIHPPPWRGLGQLHSIRNLFSDKQILYLHIFSKKDGKVYFGAGTRFDIYILQNTPNTKKTEVIDELGKKVPGGLKLNEWPFLPNYDYDNIRKILTTETKGIDVIYSRSDYGTDKKNMKNKKQGAFKYPVVHSINQTGLVFWYTNDKSKGHFGTKKVLLNFNEIQYPYNDYKGEYGMSQITFGIPIKSKAEGELIIKAINSPAFKEIIKATKWGAFQTDYRMFKYFKPDFYKNPMFKVGPKTRKHRSLPLPSRKHTKKRKHRSLPLPSKKHTRKHRSLPSRKHTRKQRSLSSRKHSRGGKKTRKHSKRKRHYRTRRGYRFA